MTETQDLSITKRAKFLNPPINEVVIAVYHLPITELRTQHIGLYWQQIRDKYPNCEQQSPVVSEDDSSIFQNMPGEVFPLPRFWFSSSAHPMLIQVQRNAFMLNWRRLQNNVDYPHYETVQKEFWNAMEIYKAFIQDCVGAKLDVVNRCELTYINVITRNKFFSTHAEIKNVLPPIEGFCNLENDARHLAGLNATAVYRINDNLLVDMVTKLGRRKDATKEEIAILEIKAHGSPVDLSLGEARNWYEVAHEAVNETFLTFTDDRVQKELWKRV